MYIRLYGKCGTDLGRSIAEVTDNIHVIGVVKPVYESSTFPLTANSRVIKRTHIKNFVNNPPYRDWRATANQSREVIKMWYTNIYSNIKIYQKYRDIH